LKEIELALESSGSYKVSGSGQLKSCFSVSKLATSSVGAVGSALSSLIFDAGLTTKHPEVIVDQRLASLWFSQSIYPIEWELPPSWDSIAGDYKTRDGWIKLHTNLSHHKSAALGVIDAKNDRQQVTSALLNWESDQLELAVVEAGGVAAALRSRTAWQAHAQGRAIASEPLITWSNAKSGKIQFKPESIARPLAGLKVFDLTRVLAGPVATRTLAGFGADVLRIDPPAWDEPFVVPDITLGKNCARLDLDQAADRATFENLLAEADVLVHGYRPGALAGLGYSVDERRHLSPNLIEVSLDAYGWTGPWSGRRGFDSLVQMSCGIAEAGMHWANSDKPTPLPVQALDHATGYMMAAAVIKALHRAMAGEVITNARLSLARTAELLMAHPQIEENKLDPRVNQSDFISKIEVTPWGNANRLRPPLNIAGVDISWELPANNLGTASASWKY